MLSLRGYHFVLDACLCGTYPDECTRLAWDGVSLKTPRPRGWVRAGRPSGGKSSFNKRNMYQYPHVSQLFILLPWQSRVYLEPLKLVEFVQLTTECCWGQPSDPCQRGCLTSHACVMWGPRTLNADDDDDDDGNANYYFLFCVYYILCFYCQNFVGQLRLNIPADRINELG